MKHSSQITLILVVVFLLSQVVGLLIVDKYIDHTTSAELGKTTFKELPYHFERPPVENSSTSFIPIAIALLIGTLLVLWLITLNKPWILRGWLFLVVVLMLSFAFAAFIHPMIALGLAIAVSLWKMFRPNIFVHNISELFIYGGLAAFFVPSLNVFAALMLLLFISLYDVIAVWHTKHMVKLAKFQTEAKMFAGLFIPYGKGGMPSGGIPIPEKTIKKSIGGSSSKKAKKDSGQAMKGGAARGRVAILGGGDMGFPLIFAGVVMKEAALHMPHLSAFLNVLIIPACAAVALYLLLVMGKKDRFYPAMPFLSAGCLVGYGVFLLL